MTNNIVPADILDMTVVEAAAKQGARVKAPCPYDWCDELHDEDDTYHRHAVRVGSFAGGTEIDLALDVAGPYLLWMPQYSEVRFRISEVDQLRTLAADLMAAADELEAFAASLGEAVSS